MTINIYNPEDDTKNIKGFTVVVDVFRAFSTAYYISSNNPQKYFLTDSINYAQEFRSNNKKTLLIGERGGVKIEGFDYGNSPTEILKKDFSSNIIVHTTTAGTKGVLAQPHGNEVIVGSFVNTEAIVKYIEDKKMEFVNIYCTAKPDSSYGIEDYYFAEYLKSRLLKTDKSFEEIVTQLRLSSGQVFVNEIFAPYTDFLMCMDINRFDFILKRKIEGSCVELVRI